MNINDAIQVGEIDGMWSFLAHVSFHESIILSLFCHVASFYSSLGISESRAIARPVEQAAVLARRGQCPDPSIQLKTT